MAEISPLRRRMIDDMMIRNLSATSNKAKRRAALWLRNTLPIRPSLSFATHRDPNAALARVSGLAPATLKRNSGPETRAPAR